MVRHDDRRRAISTARAAIAAPGRLLAENRGPPSAAHPMKAAFYERTPAPLPRCCSSAKGPIRSPPGRTARAQPVLVGRQPVGREDPRQAQKQGAGLPAHRAAQRRHGRRRRSRCGQIDAARMGKRVWVGTRFAWAARTAPRRSSSCCSSASPWRCPRARPDRPAPPRHPALTALHAVPTAARQRAVGVGRRRRRRGRPLCAAVRRCWRAHGDRHSQQRGEGARSLRDAADHHRPPPREPRRAGARWSPAAAVSTAHHRVDIAANGAADLDGPCARAGDRSNPSRQRARRVHAPFFRRSRRTSTCAGSIVYHPDDRPIAARGGCARVPLERGVLVAPDRARRRAHRRRAPADQPRAAAGARAAAGRHAGAGRGQPPAIADVLHGRDDRLVVVVGPCSIHDHDQALEYAHAAARRGRCELRANCW